MLRLSAYLAAIALPVALVLVAMRYLSDVAVLLGNL